MKGQGQNNHVNIVDIVFALKDSNSNSIFIVGITVMIYFLFSDFLMRYCIFVTCYVAYQYKTCVCEILIKNISCRTSKFGGSCGNRN